MEKWKAVPEFEGLYEVSTTGRVRSLTRRQFNGKGVFTRLGQILKPGKVGAGYLQIHLANRGKTKDLLVSRIVAEAFVPNPEGKPEVNHRNGNKLDCTSANLEWVTHAENVNHAFANGLYPPRNGEAGSGSKLKNSQVIEIRKRFAEGDRQIDLAREFGVGDHTIRDIVRRNTWKHI